MTCNTTHARKRLAERHGITDPAAPHRIAEMIRKRRDVRIIGTRNAYHRAAWKVQYEGRELVVVYDHKLREVVTVLPVGAIGYQNRKD